MPIKQRSFVLRSPRRTKLYCSMTSRQECRKRYDGCCFFCGVDNYNVLEAHRLFPGSKGGKYDAQNILVCCSNCHTLIHSGEIKVDERRYQTTTGKSIIHFFINGKEFWLPDQVSARGSQGNHPQ